jgi:ATP-dependent RNA helicase DeaD
VAPARAPVRHADFATWQPPEEEGDDQPILGDSPAAGGREPVPPMHRATDPSGASATDYAEIFVSIGRRDGVRSADIQELLVDHIGIDKDDVKRIRVRERNAFISVRKSEAQRAIDGISKASWGNRPLTAEIARERPGAGEADGESVTES